MVARDMVANSDSKREVVMGIFALGIILAAVLCTFGTGKIPSLCDAGG